MCVVLCDGERMIRAASAGIDLRRGGPAAGCVRQGDQGGSPVGAGMHLLLHHFNYQLRVQPPSDPHLVQQRQQPLHTRIQLTARS